VCARLGRPPSYWVELSAEDRALLLALEETANAVPR
jgi:hypothetical protein